MRTLHAGPLQRELAREQVGRSWSGARGRGRGVSWAFLGLATPYTFVFSFLLLLEIENIFWGFK
jgi:hypothetical protein